jgi:hypothetical protein
MENTEVLLIATKETGLEQAYLTCGSRANCKRRSFTRMLPAKMLEMKRRLLTFATPERAL